MVGRACVPTLAALALLGCAANARAEMATTLWSDDPWDFGWDERLGAASDPEVLVGFSRHAREVKAGIWGSDELTAIGSSSSDAAWLPGLGPLYKDGEIALDSRADCALPYVFARARVSLRGALGSGYRDVPNGEPRSVWTGSDPTMDLDRIEFVPRATLGFAALRHVVAASNEPFHWGPGIFGGVVMGQADRGFPHAVLTTGRPWVLADLNDEPIQLRTESVCGVLDDTRIGPEDPLLVAHRIGLRWSWLELGWNVAREMGGRHQTLPGGDQRAWYPVWAAGDFDDQSRANTIASWDLALDIAGCVRIGGEYGVDNLLPQGEAHGVMGRYAPDTAAWLLNLDAYDLTGDGATRMAGEWFRSEGYFYAPTTTTGGWDYRDAPIAYADGGNAQSVRVLFQRRLADPEATATLVLGWRELGRRSAPHGDPSTAYGTAPAAFAPRTWTTLSADLRYAWDAGFATMELFGGARSNRNRYFTDQSGFDGEGGVGIRKDY